MHINDDGTIIPVYMNRGFCRLVGMALDEATDMYHDDAMCGVHPDDVGIVISAVNKILTFGEARSEKYRLRHGGGGYVYIMFFGRLITSDTGERFLNIYYTDISSQELLDRQREELLENLPCGAGIYEIESDNHITITYLNRRYIELVGREINFGNKDISALDAVMEEDKSTLLQALSTAVKSGSNTECDIHILHGDGTYRPYHLLGHVMKQSDGKISIYTTYIPVNDSTAIYRQMLPIALSTVMNSSPDISFIKDRNLRYICGSRSFMECVGCSDTGDIIGKTDYDLLAPEYAEKYNASDMRILESGKPELDYDERLPYSDGTSIYAITSKYPIMDDTGNIIGIYGVGRDVTESRIALKQLQMLNDNIPGGIVSFKVTQDSLKLLYFSDGFYEYSGYTKEQFIKKCEADPFFIIFPDDVPAAYAAIDAVRRGDETIADCIYRCRAKDGGYRRFNMKGSVSERNDGFIIINAVQIDITEQTEAEERLRVSEEQFRIAAAIGDRTVARYNIKTGVYYNNSEMLYSQGFGSEIPDVPNAFIKSGFVNDVSADDFIGIYDKLRRGADNASATVLLRTSDNSYRWFRIDATTVYNRENEPSEAIMVLYDVTEQREKEAVYMKWQQSLHEKPDDSYTMFCCNLSKDNLLDSFNGSLLQISFSSKSMTFNARTAEYARKYVYAEDRPGYIALLNSDTLLANYYRGERMYTLEYRELTSADEFRWLRLSMELVEYPDSTDIIVYLMYENIDKYMRQQIHSKELAEHDPLTGLYNRSAFSEKMNAETSVHPDGMLSAFLMLDIDGFKLVNDTFGHAAGDLTLIDIANSLKSVFRHDDLTCRLGGDEFIAYFKGAVSRASIGKKAKQICDLLRKSFSVEVQISASVGIAVYPDDGKDFDELYHKADIALYHVKATGKDNYAFYNDDMSGEAPHYNDTETPPLTEKSKDKLKRRMLIVEDNKLSREILTNIFEDDYIIETADDGASALIRLHRYGAGISVVLLDLIMPGMDGFTVLEKMRSSADMQNIPVIIVSGMDERETALRVIKCGASDFITKPVDTDLLRIRVESAVSKAENDRLRVMNMQLSAQSDDLTKYKAAIDAQGMALVEYDIGGDTYYYGDTVQFYLYGNYDSRPLCRILSDDGVAAPADIERIANAVASACSDELADDIIKDKKEAVVNAFTAKMKTPSGNLHDFRVRIIRQPNISSPKNMVILTFTDIEIGDKY